MHNVTILIDSITFKGEVRNPGILESWNPGILDSLGFQGIPSDSKIPGFRTFPLGLFAEVFKYSDG
jgi:hypothetical protein